MSEQPTESAVSVIEDFADGTLALDQIAATLNQRGWVYTGPDTALVTNLLADPHRNDHLLELRDDGWTMQHPIAERINGDLFACPLNHQGHLMNQEWENDANAEGRYRIWLEGDDEAPELAMQGLPETDEEATKS